MFAFLAASWKQRLAQESARYSQSTDSSQTGPRNARGLTWARSGIEAMQSRSSPINVSAAFWRAREAVSGMNEAGGGGASTS